METRIKEEINRVEEKYGIEVLWACETGSRAWGFPSPDSDYDVRLIYRHKLDWYLSLKEQKDNIEYMSDDRELDLTGWDIRKSLRLLKKSNASLLERIQSNIVYKKNDAFAESFLEQAKLNYSPITTLYHYMKLGENGYDAIYGQKEYKLKKLFYALRGAVACEWVMQKDTMPPISFIQMLDELELGKLFVKRVKELIELKSVKNESYMHSGEGLLQVFIESTLEKAKKNANSLPGKKIYLNMDNYFREVVKM